MTHILLVEDEENLIKGIKDYLTLEGYNVTVCRNVAESLKVTLSHFNLALLDWMLPDGQGVDLLREIRAKSSIPIIMLTARAHVADKVLALELGANDYLTKPFEPRELVARIRVQLRSSPKAERPTSTQVICVAGIELEPESRCVRFNGDAIELTKVEFDLLALFMEFPNKVFSRNELLDRVWGYNSYPTTRTVDTHILQLRQKMSDELFETVRGVGYRLRTGT